MNHVHAGAEKNSSTVMAESSRKMLETVTGAVNRLFGSNIRTCLCMLILSAPLLGRSQHSIQENASVERMLQVYAQKNKAQESVKAWRIQVAAMTERRSMENEKVRFENLYPYYRLEWTYDNPYYLLKIRGRAYQDKLDALHLLHQLKDRFPSAILVLDDVKREDLLETSNR